MKEKEKAQNQERSRKARGKVMKKVAADVRWTVHSWLLPAASEARWEQNRGPESPEGGKS